MVKIIKNKNAGLLGVFVVMILGVMVFLGLNTFLLSNVEESGRDVSSDPIMMSIATSQEKLNETSQDMKESSEAIQERIKQISEANVLIAGLYLSAGVLDIFKYILNSIQYITTGINALFNPISAFVPGFGWIVAGIVLVLTIYIIFKILEAISGRQNI